MTVPLLPLNYKLAMKFVYKEHYVGVKAGNFCTVFRFGEVTYQAESQDIVGMLLVKPKSGRADCNLPGI